MPHFTTLGIAINKLSTSQQIRFCAYSVPAVSAGKCISLLSVGSNQPAVRGEVAGTHNGKSTSAKHGYNPEPQTVPLELCLLALLSCVALFSDKHPKSWL